MCRIATRIVKWIIAVVIPAAVILVIGVLLILVILRRKLLKQDEYPSHLYAPLLGVEELGTA